MAHASGLFTLLFSIQSGAPFVLLESFDADTVLDTIERSDVVANLRDRGPAIVQLAPRHFRP
jgi:hypothetical protein